MISAVVPCIRGRVFCLSCRETPHCQCHGAAVTAFEMWHGVSVLVVKFFLFNQQSQVDIALAQLACADTGVASVTCLPCA